MQRRTLPQQILSNLLRFQKLEEDEDVRKEESRVKKICEAAQFQYQLQQPVTNQLVTKMSLAVAQNLLRCKRAQRSNRKMTRLLEKLSVAEANVSVANAAEALNGNVIAAVEAKEEKP